MQSPNYNKCAPITINVLQNCILDEKNMVYKY